MRKISRIYDAEILWGDIHLGDQGMWDRTYSKFFNTKEEYFNTLIKNNNYYAKENSVVVFFGDIGKKEHFHILKEMKGYKILIKGNHDKLKNNIYEEYFDEIFEHAIQVKNRVVFSHIPVVVEEGVLNVHGHTHDITLLTKNHMNICPEKTDFKPVRMKTVLNKLSYLKKPSYKFLEEWYKHIQVSPPREDLVLDGNRLILVNETLIKKEEKNEGETDQLHKWFIVEKL